MLKPHTYAESIQQQIGALDLFMTVFYLFVNDYFYGHTLQQAGTY